MAFDRPLAPPPDRIIDLVEERSAGSLDLERRQRDDAQHDRDDSDQQRPGHVRIFADRSVAALGFRQDGQRRRRLGSVAKRHGYFRSHVEMRAAEAARQMIEETPPEVVEVDGRQYMLRRLPPTGLPAPVDHAPPVRLRNTSRSFRLA